MGTSARWAVGPLAIALLILACGPPQERVNASALQSDLAAMRSAITKYRQDKGHPPSSLDELVRARYLRAIPNDPITGKPDWRVMIEQQVHVDEFQTTAQAGASGGIIDVRSSAPGRDENGRAWADY